MGSTRRMASGGSGLSRRTFLKRSAGVATAAAAASLLPRVARAQEAAAEPLEGPINWLVSTPALVEPEAIEEAIISDAIDEAYEVDTAARGFTGTP